MSIDNYLIDAMYIPFIYALVPCIVGTCDMTLFQINGIRISWIGIITMHLRIRVGSKAMKPSPISMVSQNVSRSKLHPRTTMSVAGRTRFHETGFRYSLLYRNSPNTYPVMNAVKVNPGKYAPEGKINIPRTSPMAYPIPAQSGPYLIPIMAIGKNPKPILRIGVLIEQNRVSTISVAIKNAIVTRRNVVDLLFICKLLYPSRVSYTKEKEFILVFWCSSGRNTAPRGFPFVHKRHPCL